MAFGDNGELARGVDQDDALRVSLAQDAFKPGTTPVSYAQQDVHSFYTKRPGFQNETQTAPLQPGERQTFEPSGRYPGNGAPLIQVVPAPANGQPDIPQYNGGNPGQQVRMPDYTRNSQPPASRQQESSGSMFTLGNGIDYLDQFFMGKWVQTKGLQKTIDKETKLSPEVETRLADNLRSYKTSADEYSMMLSKRYQDVIQDVLKTGAERGQPNIKAVALDDTKAAAYRAKLAVDNPEAAEAFDIYRKFARESTAVGNASESFIKSAVDLDLKTPVIKPTIPPSDVLGTGKYNPWSVMSDSPEAITVRNFSQAGDALTGDLKKAAGEYETRVGGIKSGNLWKLGLGFGADFLYDTSHTDSTPGLGTWAADAVAAYLTLKPWSIPRSVMTTVGLHWLGRTFDASREH